MYCAISKLTNTFLRIHGEHTRGDLSAAKRGVRCDNDINSHEAMYRVIERSGKLELFNELYHNAHFRYDVRAMMNASNYIGQLHTKYHRLTQEEIESSEALLKFCQAIQYEVDQELKVIGDKNIDWNLVTSVEFCRMQAAKRALIPVSHIVEKGKKSK